MLRTQADIEIEVTRARHVASQVELLEENDGSVNNTANTNPPQALYRPDEVEWTPRTPHLVASRPETVRQPMGSTPINAQNNDVLVKLAKAILKTREPRIKKFDGNLRQYVAFRASFSKLA